MLRLTGCSGEASVCHIFWYYRALICTSVSFCTILVNRKENRQQPQLWCMQEDDNGSASARCLTSLPGLNPGPGLIVRIKENIIKTFPRAQVIKQRGCSSFD